MFPPRKPITFLLCVKSMKELNICVIFNFLSRPIYFICTLKIPIRKTSPLGVRVRMVHILSENGSNLVQNVKLSNENGRKVYSFLIYFIHILFLHTAALRVFGSDTSMSFIFVNCLKGHYILSVFLDHTNVRVQMDELLLNVVVWLV